MGRGEGAGAVAAGLAFPWLAGQRGAGQEPSWRRLLALAGALGAGSLGEEPLL